MKRCCVLVCLLAMVGCKSQTGATRGVPDAVPILRQAHGDDKGLTKQAIVLVNSAAELAATGAQTLGEVSPAPDFASESVILMALGERPTGGFWASIDAVQSDGQSVYVQGRANRPGQGSQVTQALTYPYCLVVIPKATGTLHPEIESVEDQAAPWLMAAPAEPAATQPTAK